MYNRLPNWIQLYEKFIHANAAQEFKYGVHDCCITSCNMIQAITGNDPASEFRGTYGIDNALQALKLVRQYIDVDGIAEVVCEKHGWPEINPNYASRCDLVCVPVDNERKAMGWIDLNATKIFVPGYTGFNEKPRSAALRAWRIG